MWIWFNKSVSCTKVVPYHSNICIGNYFWWSQAKSQPENLSSTIHPLPSNHLQLQRMSQALSLAKIYQNEISSVHISFNYNTVVGYHCIRNPCTHYTCTCRSHFWSKSLLENWSLIIHSLPSNRSHLKKCLQRSQITGKNIEINFLHIVKRNIQKFKFLLVIWNVPYWMFDSLVSRSTNSSRLSIFMNVLAFNFPTK